MFDYSLPSNTILKSTYLIQKVIGQGGFGITYKVRHLILEKELCIKELFVSGLSTRGENNTVNAQQIGDIDFNGFKKRFLEEAKQLAKFNHPHIVRVIDAFEENETAYMVMEYEHGSTLKKHIEQYGLLNTELAFNVMHQLLNAVEEVHQKNMLHRDIKPDNIILKPNGSIVLLDFGSARQFGEGKTITQTAMLTPGYAPKEQYSTRAKRGVFTDIYSLGATLYYLLTGKKPTPSIDREEEKLLSPHKINPKVTTQISSAIMLAMELKPEDRFQTIADFREALNTLQKEELDLKKTKIIEKPTINLTYHTNNENLNEIQDIDGNIYNEVKIGNQIWLTKNLNVSRFTDGHDLFYAKTDEDWIKALEKRLPAYCYYDCNDENQIDNGKLYNFYAVKNSRDLIPENFKLPENKDFEQLVNTTGGFDKAGKILRDYKESFHLSLSGARNKNGIFYGLKDEGYYWSKNEESLFNARALEVFSYWDTVRFIYQNKGFGFSIRCIKNL